MLKVAGIIESERSLQNSEEEDKNQSPSMTITSEEIPSYLELVDEEPKEVFIYNETVLDQLIIDSLYSPVPNKVTE